MHLFKTGLPFDNGTEIYDSKTLIEDIKGDYHVVVVNIILGSFDEAFVSQNDVNRHCLIFSMDIPTAFVPILTPTF